MEQGMQWKFVTQGDGQWRWTAGETNSHETASACGFASIEDCMADAARHGYANYRPTEAAYA